jgi:hypothetical protein
MNFVISPKNAETIKLLREGLAGCEEVSVVKLAPDHLFTVEGLDAFYSTVMGAERWGALPIPRKAQILSVGSEDRINGYPPYVIAGSLFDIEDSRDPEFQLRVIVRSVLTAVESFNEQHDHAIAKIGFWSDDLCLPGINARAAGQIIKEEYEAYYKREAK